MILRTGAESETAAGPELMAWELDGDGAMEALVHGRACSVLADIRENLSELHALCDGLDAVLGRLDGCVKPLRNNHDHPEITSFRRFLLEARQTLVASLPRNFFPWTSLPQDLRERVMTFLTYRDVACLARAVDDRIVSYEVERRNSLLRDLRDLLRAPSGSQTTAGWEEQTRRLAMLSLTDLRLQSLPLGVTEFDNLDHLDVSRNSLADLPMALTRCTKLRRLNMASNNFTSLPLVVLQLRTLEQLSMSSNKIESLPEDIGQRLPRLDDFDALRCENLRRLPMSLLMPSTQAPGKRRLSLSLRYLDPEEVERLATHSNSFVVIWLSRE